MGNCTFNCMPSKQTETYSIQQAPKQTNLPPFQQLSSRPLSQFRNQIQAQSSIRGYLLRKTFKNHLHSINLDFLTQPAAQSFQSLPKFPYKPQNPHSIWLPLTDFNQTFKYMGQINSLGEPQGNGLMYSSNGSLLQGNWQKGLLDGQGRKIFAQGDVYTGNFLKGKMQGKGKLQYFSRKTSYQGDFLDDQPHGVGVQYWPDGGTYIGEYQFGEKNGQGMFQWKDGSWFKGSFRNGRIHGYGKYCWKKGREYEGQWRENKMHGEGSFFWADGRSYKGQYVNDKKEGFGVYCWPNGKKYEGMWRDGKQHGLGKLVSSLGKEKSGLWNSGKLVEISS